MMRPEKVTAHVSDEDRRNLFIRTHARGWDEAFSLADVIRRNTPPGYRYLSLKIAQRKENAGQRLSVTIVLRHVDRREPELTSGQALQHVAKARLRQETPATNETPTTSASGEDGSI